MLPTLLSLSQVTVYGATTHPQDYFAAIQNVEIVDLPPGKVPVNNKDLRPHPDDVRVVDQELAKNPLAQALVNWAGAEQATARLALKWEGTTQSVRAFTCTPSTSVVNPRSIYFTRQVCTAPKHAK